MLLMLCQDVQIHTSARYTKGKTKCKQVTQSSLQRMPFKRLKACLHRRAVTESGNGKAVCRAILSIYTQGRKPVRYANKYVNVCFTLQRPCQPVRDVIPNETADWPERAVSARYLWKSLRFLKPAVYRPTARFVRTQCKQSRRKPCVLFFYRAEFRYRSSV